MELELIRTYFPNGTNGTLYHNGKRICFTIELPWLNNEHQISCIPEGRYELTKRFSEHFGEHFQLMNVPRRSLILMHPANDALKELKGCIAPVSNLTAEGKGKESKKALQKLRQLVFPILEKKEKVFLTIKAVQYELN
jgi:hypothetical protein